MTRSTMMATLTKAREHWPAPDLPMSESEIAVTESEIGHQLPAVLREIYRAYGLTDLLALLTFHDTLGKEELTRFGYGTSPEDYVHGDDMHFFAGNFYFRPS